MFGCNMSCLTYSIDKQKLLVCICGRGVMAHSVSSQLENAYYKCRPLYFLIGRKCFCGCVLMSPLRIKLTLPVFQGVLTIASGILEIKSNAHVSLKQMSVPHSFGPQITYRIFTFVIQYGAGYTALRMSTKFSVQGTSCHAGSSSFPSMMICLPLR